jgi:predicted lipid-binding transport protein (Tim44 family)
MTRALIITSVGALCATLIGCQAPQPVPVECVCDCTSPEALSGAQATGKAEAADAESKLAEARLRRAKKLEAARDKKRAAVTQADKPSPAPKTRAAEVVRAEPGSGKVVTLADPAHRLMTDGLTGVLKAVGSRNLEAMRPFLTPRLYESLKKNMPRYEERFFGGLREAAEALQQGVKVVETRDMGRGNIEALFQFRSGYERRVIFFKQGDAWRINRL